MLKVKEDVLMMFARFRKPKGLCEFECGWVMMDTDAAVRLCNRAAKCLAYGAFNWIELCKEHSSLLVPRTHRRKRWFNRIGLIN
jgi:hypothetical protein